MNIDFEIIFAVLLFCGVAVLIPVLFNLTALLGPRDTNTLKDQAYESGITTPMVIGNATQQFSVKYYLIAIIFVIFDIEVVFMYPWAINLEKLGVFGLVEMFIFMGILFIGLLYIYGKKILNWQ